jgi:hypothetical protein
VLPGSHRYSGFIKNTALRTHLPMGFKTQAATQPWVVGALDAGDVLLLDSQVCAASTENRRDNFFRASLDCRVLLLGERNAMSRRS